MKTWILAVVIVGAVLGLVGCSEELGPRIRRECTSLVTELLKQDRGVNRAQLESELEKIEGRPLPLLPARPDWSPLKPWTQVAQKAYDDAFEVREAQVGAMMARHPEVRHRLFAERREAEINKCVITRAAKEGARI